MFIKFLGVHRNRRLGNSHHAFRGSKLGSSGKYLYFVSLHLVHLHNLQDAVNRAMGQQEPVPGDAGVDPTSPFSPPDPVVIGPPVLQSSHQSSPEVEVVQPMPAPPSPPHMINIDDDSVMVSGMDSEHRISYLHSK